MSDKRSDTDETPSQAAAGSSVGLPVLARRLVRALPLAERRRLAIQLIANEVDEITFCRDGITWTVLPWDHVISHEIFVTDSFQGPEVQAVLAWMRRQGRFAGSRDCIVDAGANIGTTTVPFAQATQCRILAIEPMPELFAVLKRNVAANGLAERVICIRSAILAGPTEVARMALPIGNGGGAEIVRSDRDLSFAGRYGVRSEAQVPAVGLKALLDTQGIVPERIAFVWSDTQGCEVDVIVTGLPLWAAGAPLFAEFDPRTWGAEREKPLVAAAMASFAGFIPAKMLIKDPDADVVPIADLPAFCRTLDENGSDCLLLP